MYYSKFKVKMLKPYGGEYTELMQTLAKHLDIVTWKIARVYIHITVAQHPRCGVAHDAIMEALSNMNKRLLIEFTWNKRR